MRTTIDLPEDLLRRAKATAALRGMKMKDLIAELVGSGLDFAAQPAETRGQNRPVPVAINAEGLIIRSVTNAEIDDILLLEDLERLGINRPA